MEKINVKYLYWILMTIGILVIIILLRYLHVFSFIEGLLIALIPFYIGFFLSWVLSPVGMFLHKKLKINLNIANFIAIILSILIILILLLIIIPVAIYQAAILFKGFPDIWRDFSNNISNFLHIFGVNITYLDIPHLVFEKIQDLDKQNLGQYVSSSIKIVTVGVGYVISFLSSVARIIAEICFGYVISFYFIGSIKGFVHATINLISGKNAEEHKKIILEMSKALFSYFRGLIIVITFVGIMVTIGAYFLGLPTPMLFGVISAITDLIPYFGPILGGIPIFVVALSVSYKTAFFAVGLICLVQFVEAYFLQPKVLSKTTKLHPVSIMVGLLIFGKLFGFIGFVLATPILAIVKVGINNSQLKGKIKL